MMNDSIKILDDKTLETIEAMIEIASGAEKEALSDILHGIKTISESRDRIRSNFKCFVASARG
tara:strand:- start:32 stop:220 length:189 start_codon:yes stop_codon:yes gene_type:complete